MKSVKFGVLGLGFIGQIHALNLLKIPGAELSALADPDPAKFRTLETAVAGADPGPGAVEALAGARRFEDGEALIATRDLDAVIVCLPTHLHEPVALMAFEQGLHVLCEKPMALEPSQADAMIRGAGKAGRLLMVAHCLRFWPEYLFLRNTLASGRLGALRSLNLWRRSAAPTWAWEGWFFKPELSGGPLVDLHIHDADFALFILGRPDRIFATGRAAGASGDLDMVHTIYQYAHGPQVHLHAGWSTAPIPFSAGYEAWFDGGFMRYATDETPSLAVYEKGREEPLEASPPEADPYEEELRYFVGCIQTGQAPEICLPESSRDALGLVRRGIESARCGEVLSWDGC